MNGTIVRCVADTGQTVFAPSGGSLEKQAPARLRILIVEDHDASRHCLEGVLQREGYVVRSLACAEEGLAHLEADHFDTLLTDLRLPGMDGFELIGKARVVQPSIRIVLMTAIISKEVYERAQMMCIDGLIEKPMELDQLLAFLDSIRLHIETGS